LLTDDELAALKEQDRINRQSLEEALRRGLVNSANGGVSTNDLVDRLGVDDAERGLLGEGKSIKGMNSWNLQANSSLNMESKIQGLRNRLFLKYMAIDFEFFNVNDIRYRATAD
jgi:hypothetical protein